MPVLCIFLHHQSIGTYSPVTGWGCAEKPVNIILTTNTIFFLDLFNFLDSKY